MLFKIFVYITNQILKILNKNITSKVLLMIVFVIPNFYLKLKDKFLKISLIFYLI